MSLDYYLNKNIEDLIRRNPGISASSIESKVSVDLQAFKKSLSYLRDKGVIYKDNKTGSYFPSWERISWAAKKKH